MSGKAVHSNERFGTVYAQQYLTGCFSVRTLMHMDSAVLFSKPESTMSKQTTIRATTTNDAIEAAVPFVDMRLHAIEMRDMAAAVLAEQGDQEVLHVHEIDGVTVLWSEQWAYAMVNQRSPGAGDSVTYGNDRFSSPEEAAAAYVAGESA